MFKKLFQIISVPFLFIGAIVKSAVHNLTFGIRYLAYCVVACAFGW